MRRAATSIGAAHLGAISAAAATLLGWGGCNTVAGLDGLVFVEQGGSGTGTVTITECGPPDTPPGECPPECSFCTDPEGVCVFDPSTPGGLQDRTLTCPAGAPCDVSCSTPGACSSLDVVCPAAYGCRLDCHDDGACTDVTVHCSSDGPCVVYCGATVACWSITLECGANDCTALCYGDPVDLPLVHCYEPSPCGCSPCEQ